ncbi:hypothetical protein [Microbacterium sp. 179-I 3D4 NHS]|uniref:hypothetical protein n=1 Tax=Microbacterium sp. 179-I 3D4 NHS TaxID=3142381 RepID=UPI0039A350AB
MVDLRSRTHGAGATKGVNLVVMAYDDLVAADPAGDGPTHYLDARVHPGDRRAPGQVDLALVVRKTERSPSVHDHAAGYSAEQLASIEKAAGDNAADLVDANGATVGRVYGVKADLLINSGEVVVNTKTLEPTELSVAADTAGRDIRTQIVEATRAAAEARRAARATAAGRN